VEDDYLLKAIEVRLKNESECNSCAFLDIIKALTLEYDKSLSLMTLYEAFINRVKQFPKAQQDICASDFAQFRRLYLKLGKKRLSELIELYFYQITPGTKVGIWTFHRMALKSLKPYEDFLK
jgi:hypothetical protein